MRPLLKFVEDDLALDEEEVIWEAIQGTGVPDSKDIRASQTTSQRLAEANHKRAPTEAEVPEHL